MNEYTEGSLEDLLQRACEILCVEPSRAGSYERELLELRQRSAAFKFLLAYDDPDPVPGATLAEYLDAAWAYGQETPEAG